MSSFSRESQYLAACRRLSVSRWRWPLRCRSPGRPRSWPCWLPGACPGGGTRSCTLLRRWARPPAPQGCGRLPPAEAGLWSRYAWQWSDLGTNTHIKTSVLFPLPPHSLRSLPIYHTFYPTNQHKVKYIYIDWVKIYHLFSIPFVSILGIKFKDSQIVWSHAQNVLSKSTKKITLILHFSGGYGYRKHTCFGVCVQTENNIIHHISIKHPWYRALQT